MFRNEEFPSWYVEDYKTLNHDIGLFQRNNGLWDLWFGQDKVSELYKYSDYLNIVEGDIVSATEIHSLQVGIVIACLTSWNYLNRTGNPIYTEFGNKSYSLLKKNKGVNTRYKIKQYFIECLKRMRRVYDVESLEVLDVENNPYVYKVVFKVLSITNTLVDGEFYLNIDSTKNTSILDLNYNHPYTSVTNPLFVECVLTDEYGSYIENEIIYVYIRSDTNAKFKFYGITESTDKYGRAYITIPPKGLSTTTQVMFIFKGNTLYNPAVSKIINIECVEYYIKSDYTYKPYVNEDGEIVKDEYGDDLQVIDKQILYVEDSKGSRHEKFKLGELLSDYVFVDEINLTDTLSIQDMYEHIKPTENWELIYNKDNSLSIDDREKYKLYLIPTNSFIEGTNKPYFHAYQWDESMENLVLTNYKVQLNTHNKNEVHFLIEDKCNGLFEIDFGDGHLYYKVDLFENEEV